MPNFPDKVNYAQLLVTLNNSKIATQNNALYQTIVGLIKSAQSFAAFSQQQFTAPDNTNPTNIVGLINALNTLVQSIRSFSTILVSGQSDVVAEIINDTLTLIAGSGVTITTNLATNEITISASGGGGSVTTTGTPASGNLAKFSGATSITNGDLSGDVTTSGTLATTIANDAVTFAKMQNITTQNLIGRDTAGTGDPELVTISQALDWL